MRKVLVIGSGPIVIGQAAEFDYSGTQACLACREAGVRSILVNSNPATIQTDPHVADVVYIEPLTIESIEQIIAAERPDGLIGTVGGQTALNLTVALGESGILERYGVKVLGTGVNTIRRGEDRALFADVLRQAGQPLLPSHAVLSADMALTIAQSIGYPVMCRSAFALGGAGSGFANNPEELSQQVSLGLLLSGSGQVLVEKSVYGWAEVEYEVVRDAAGNCMVVCNMENLDPMGVHTGESIVVAPSQTLSDREYHMLRDAAIAVVRELGVEGGCNIQFALNRETSRYYVIEVNPRLSRSSALASKATGYPIAKVATRIALGQTLPEIRNDITGTSAFFEPALDYVVVKIPRWPFDKFGDIKPVIGTSMKSTGEAMAIGRTFEEAMEKAIRSGEVDTSPPAPPPHPRRGGATDAGTRLEERGVALLAEPTANRLPMILSALREGANPADIVEATKIHPWFIDRLSAISGVGTTPAAISGGATSRRYPSPEMPGVGATPRGCPLPDEGGQRQTHEGQTPQPEGQISNPEGQRQGHEGRVRGPAPTGNYVYKMVDTCAAEFEAATPYFYSARIPGGQNEAVSMPGPKAIILGSGPIRIGQGIEFDYSTVHACHALSEADVKSIIVNNNPETVSTDYSTSDRLYFEPLDEQAVMAVVENEREGLLGVIPQFGGQTAINLVHALQRNGVPILGTQPEAIDAAEDRGKTSAVLEELGIPAPRWRSVERWEELPAAVGEVGYPALLRPSYVLSGHGMTIVHSDGDVRRYLETHAGKPLEKPLLVDHFLQGAVELDVDAVSDGEDVVSIVMEQLEECGVHSGDSTEVYPVQSVAPATVETVEAYTRRLAEAFGIVGLMNVQYAVLDGEVYVLEVNPRASRSVPFASKASGVPLADLAVRAILGARLSELDVPEPRTDRVSVKAVVFPFRVFPGLAPVLGPRMQSTGESMGIGRSFGEAYWKAWLGRGFKRLPLGNPVYISAPPGAFDGSVDGRHSMESMSSMLEAIELLAAAGCPVVVSPDMGLADTPARARLGSHGVRLALTTRRPHEVKAEELGMAIVLGGSRDDLTLLRRCVDAGVPYISTAGGLHGLLRALAEGKPELRAEPLLTGDAGERSYSVA